MIPSMRANWVAIFVICVVSVLLAIFPVADEDIWWHLRTGYYILENSSLPRNDIQTFTALPQTNWHDIQWAFQVLAAILYKSLGWSGIILYRVFSVLLLGATLWTWLHKRGYGITITTIVVLVTLISTRYRFAARPELLTFAMLALQLMLYDRSLKAGLALPWAVLPVQWVWANFHSSSVLGIFACGAYLVVKLSRSHPDVPSRRIWIQPVFLFTACIVVSMLNPNHINAQLYGLTESVRQYIEEFQPTVITFWTTASGIILASGVLGAVRSGRREPFLLIVCIAFFLQSLRMNRFFPYMAIATVPFQASAWEWVYSKNMKRASVRTLIQALAAIVMISVCALSLYADRKPFRLGTDITKYPEPAVNFLKQNGLTGRLFHTFNPGGYISWCLRPQRVFIFNETKLNGPLLDEMVTADTIGKWSGLVKRYAVNAALVPCNYTINTTQTLADVFAYDKEWRLVFWDDTDMVFLKATKEYEEIIARHQKKVVPEGLPYIDNPRTNLGALRRVAQTTGVLENALHELDIVTSNSPRHFRAQFTKGLLLKFSGVRDDRVLDAFNRAAAVNNTSADLLSHLGTWYAEHGEVNKANDHFKRAVEVSASPTDARFNWALALYRAGNVIEARQQLDKVLKDDPAHQPALKLIKSLQSPAR